MKKILTQDDAKYIESLKDYLSEIQYDVYKKGNTYLEIENHLLPFEKNNQQFIHHFTQDVINETQLYTYKIRSKRTYSEDFSSHIYQSNVSPWLMLKTIQSFDDDGKTLRNAIKEAINHQDFNFAFECLALPQSYIEFEHKHLDFYYKHPLASLTECLILWVDEFPEHKELFHRAFTEHIQNSSLTIDKADLINLYTAIFTQYKIDEFLSHTGYGQIESLCVDEKEKTLSLFYINVATFHIGKMENIDTLNEHIQENNFSFPPFYVLKHAQDRWTVAVENTEPNASLKVQTLLTQLVHNEFSLNDEDSIQKLSTFIEQIHLEFSLNSISNKQTHKNKI